MRETESSIKAAMAPAKKEQPKQAEAQVNPVGDTGESLGFGVPPTPKQEVHVVPLHTLGKDKKTTIDNPDCLAKRVTVKGPDGEVLRYKFYVKVGISGYVYDPWGTFSEGSHSRFARTHGKPAWDWSEISDSAFAYYLKYLQTRNKTWYAHVDRELRHA
jgi:hypothetical protein